MKRLLITCVCTLCLAACSSGGGQILFVTDGEGRHQIRGGEIETLHPGDVVAVEPDVEHWHGAAPDSWFSHVAVTPNAQDNKAVWLEPVTDKEYK